MTDFAASTRRAIERVGETIAIRRAGVDTNTTARVTRNDASSLAGEAVQGRFHLIALVDTLADLLPITTADAVVVRGRQYQIVAVDDNSRRVGGTLIALNIEAEG